MFSNPDKGAAVPGNGTAMTIKTNVSILPFLRHCKDAPGCINEVSGFQLTI